MLSSITEFVFDVIYWNLIGTFVVWFIDCACLNSRDCKSLIVSVFICTIARLVWEIKIILDEIHEELMKEDTSEYED